MLPASNRAAGANLGFPDPCPTAVGPVVITIPYPNMALNAMAVPFALTVFISGVNGLNMAAQIPITTLDQLGIPGPAMGPGRYTMGNMTVIIEGQPAIGQLSQGTGNNGICGLSPALIPSITNVLYSLAGAASPAPPRGEAQEACLLDGTIATLAIPVFSSGVPALVYSAVHRLGAFEAMILDLRGNPGGELWSAVELAGDFLDPGTLVVTAIDGDGDETVYRSHQERPYRFPLFVLVDRNTASAAEIFAGSLKAHGRAVVVGEPTYGKGSAQALVPGVVEPGARYLTVATLTLPNGEPIEGRGVCPDIDVPADLALRAALTAARQEV